LLIHIAAKNGVYISLVKDVRNVFEGSPLVKIDCKGMHASDYKKLGAKLKVCNIFCSSNSSVGNNVAKSCNFFCPSNSSGSNNVSRSYIQACDTLLGIKEQNIFTGLDRN
jgi:hypothetical protein